MSKGNRKRRKALGIIPEHEKCKARNRFGEPCGNYPIEGAVVCRVHGGSAPQVKRKAQELIAMAQDDAAALLVQFMASDKVPFAEWRRCAEFLLTYETRNEVQLQVFKWESLLEGDDLIVDFGSADVLDGEVVDEYEDANYPERRAPIGERPTPFPSGVPRDPSPPRYSEPAT